MTGFLLMAFDDDDEPIGRFFIEENFRLLDCSNGWNVLARFISLRFVEEFFYGGICF